MQVERCRQVVAVPTPRLGAGTLKLLPALGGSGSVGEVEHIEIRFLVHEVEDGMSSLPCRMNFGT